MFLIYKTKWAINGFIDSSFQHTPPSFQRLATFSDASQRIVRALR